jgi:hypothetical protein
MFNRSMADASTPVHAGCYRPWSTDEPSPRVDPRSACVRDMDRCIADAVSRHGLTRGAALALYGEAVERHPEDPCSAREQLAEALGDLVLA